MEDQTDIFAMISGTTQKTSTCKNLIHEPVHNIWTKPHDLREIIPCCIAVIFNLCQLMAHWNSRHIIFFFLQLTLCMAHSRHTTLPHTTIHTQLLMLNCHLNCSVNRQLKSLSFKIEWNVVNSMRRIYVIHSGRLVLNKLRMWVQMESYHHSNWIEIYSISWR